MTTNLNGENQAKPDYACAECGEKIEPSPAFCFCGTVHPSKCSKEHLNMICEVHHTVHLDSDATNSYAFVYTECRCQPIGKKDVRSNHQTWRQVLDDPLVTPPLMSLPPLRAVQPPQQPSSTFFSFGTTKR